MVKPQRGDPTEGPKNTPPFWGRAVGRRSSPPSLPKPNGIKAAVATGWEAPLAIWPRVPRNPCRAGRLNPKRGDGWRAHRWTLEAPKCEIPSIPTMKTPQGKASNGQKGGCFWVWGFFWTPSECRAKRARNACCVSSTSYGAADGAGAASSPGQPIWGRLGALGGGLGCIGVVGPLEAIAAPH